MKAKIVVLLLAIILSGCVPATIPAQTAVLPTLKPNPTATVIFAIPTPSLIPTQPPVPILTPDAIQVQRWREYQTELAKALFAASHNPEGGFDPEAYKTALCEWDILGQESQTVFVFVTCVGNFVPGEALIDHVGARPSPAVIFLELDGSVQNVVIPDFKYDSSLSQFYDLNLFPLETREKLCMYYFSGSVPQCGNIVASYQPSYSDPPRLGEFFSHLAYRTTHLDEPPLIVLLTMPPVPPTP